MAGMKDYKPVKISNLNCIVKSGKKILSDLELSAYPGEIMAIMGPSGSGKTTLLNFIGNRRTKGLNFKCRSFKYGTQTVTNSFWKEVKFVEQEDHLHGFMTVRSLLNQYITLNYGIRVDQKVRNTMITEILNLTGLSDTENTRIGDVFRKGISGGQKRRLSVAVELVSRPKILVLDEPTSGLDSASAYHIIRALSKIAQTMNAVIIMSIHQPSSEIWAHLDRLVILSKGMMMFEGQNKDILPAFEFAGDVCPERFNPADFIISLVNSDFDANVDLHKYKSKFLEWKEQHGASSTIELQRQYTAKSSMSEQVEALKKNLVQLEKTSANCLTHFTSLLWRNLANNALNPGVFGIRFFMYTMLAVLIGLMFFNLGDQDDHSSIISRCGLFMYIAAFFIFMSIAAMPFFLMERAIFEKEYGNNLYGVVAYVIAQTVATVPGVLLISVVSSIIVVFMANIEKFDIFLADLFLALLGAEQIALFIAVLVPHYIIGMALVAGLYGFFMLCEGFMVIYSDIPVYLQWGNHIAIQTYSFRAFMVNEFSEISELDSKEYPTGDDVLEFYDMDDHEVSDDLISLFIYWIVLIILTLSIMLLKYRKTVPRLTQSSDFEQPETVQLSSQQDNASEDDPHKSL